MALNGSKSDGWHGTKQKQTNGTERSKIRRMPFEWIKNGGKEKVKKSAVIIIYLEGGKRGREEEKKRKRIFGRIFGSRGSK